MVDPRLTGVRRSSGPSGKRPIHGHSRAFTVFLFADRVARVGLIYPKVESIFIDAVLAAVAVVAAEKGVQLQTRSAEHASPEGTADIARDMVRSGVQALLLLPPYAEILGEHPDILDLGAPAAAIATAVPLPHITTIRIDNRAASRAVTERLIDSGRQDIAVLAGPQQHSDRVARLDGYRDALRAHELPIDPALCVGDFTFASGLAAAERLLDLSPRARCDRCRQ